MNAIKVQEATGIKYQLGSGTEDWLVEKLPEGELNLVVSWSHS
ncbi:MULTISPECIES: hypothetical protein [Cyanophyceae]|jgi:hypothetical protein|nr:MULTISPECIES: hypothetical protein [unclassified Trichocoleus]